MGSGHKITCLAKTLEQSITTVFVCLHAKHFLPRRQLKPTETDYAKSDREKKKNQMEFRERVNKY